MIPHQYSRQQPLPTVFVAITLGLTSAVFGGPVQKSVTPVPTLKLNSQIVPEEKGGSISKLKIALDDGLASARKSIHSTNSTWSDESPQSKMTCFQLGILENHIRQISRTSKDFSEAPISKVENNSTLNLTEQVDELEDLNLNLPSYCGLSTPVKQQYHNSDRRAEIQGEDLALVAILLRVEILLSKMSENLKSLDATPAATDALKSKTTSGGTLIQVN